MKKLRTGQFWSTAFDATHTFNIRKPREGDTDVRTSAIKILETGQILWRTDIFSAELFVEKFDRHARKIDEIYNSEGLYTLLDIDEMMKVHGIKWADDYNNEYDRFTEVTETSSRVSNFPVGTEMLGHLSGNEFTSDQGSAIIFTEEAPKGIFRALLLQCVDGQVVFY